MSCTINQCQDVWMTISARWFIFSYQTYIKVWNGSEIIGKDCNGALLPAERLAPCWHSRQLRNNRRHWFIAPGIKKLVQSFLYVALIPICPDKVVSWAYRITRSLKHFGTTICSMTSSFGPDLYSRYSMSSLIKNFALWPSSSSSSLNPSISLMFGPLAAFS